MNKPYSPRKFLDAQVLVKVDDAAEFSKVSCCYPVVRKLGKAAVVLGDASVDQELQKVFDDATVDEMHRLENEMANQIELEDLQER